MTKNFLVCRVESSAGDWAAVEDDPNQLMGFGNTEQEAIDDLRRQITQRKEILMLKLTSEYTVYQEDVERADALLWLIELGNETDSLMYILEQLFAAYRDKPLNGFYAAIRFVRDHLPEDLKGKYHDL